MTNMFSSTFDDLVKTSVETIIEISNQAEAKKRQKPDDSSKAKNTEVEKTKGD